MTKERRHQTLYQKMDLHPGANPEIVPQFRYNNWEGINTGFAQTSYSQKPN